MKNRLSLFCSMKVGLALLAVFGIYAAAGSVLQPETYMHTPLFAILGLLVTANMLLCTLRQMLQLGRLLLRGPKQGPFWPVLRKAAVTFLHLGILIVVIGVLMSGGREMSRFGMYVGDTADLAEVSQGGSGTLAFTDFALELDDSGRIVQYRADVRLDGREATLRVNQPMRAGRGRLLFGEYLDSVTVEIRENGEEHVEKIGNGDGIPFRNGTCHVRLLRYVPDYEESDWMTSSVHRGDNPRLVFVMSTDTEPETLYVAKFGDTIPLGDGGRFRFTEAEPYVVFAYTRDPGSVPVAAGSGLVLLCLGLWMICREKSGKKDGKG